MAMKINDRRFVCGYSEIPFAYAGIASIASGIFEYK